MVPTPKGLVPAPGYLKKLLNILPELKSDIIPEYQIKEFDPLLDSSNMTPDKWVAIAGDIARNYFQYDGFVVLHGTDTMAYTASALSFMLEGLGKPVVLTGSQIPICEVRNDARVNLITALIIAGTYRIPEVCLFFDDKLLRGCRSVKVKADQLDAFSSPNFPPLGTAGAEIRINWDLVLPPKDGVLTINEFPTYPIGTLRLFPGISVEVLENMIRPPLKGLVLEVYGSGTAPDRDGRLLNVLKQAAEITACTQCLRGMVKLDQYAAGSALAGAGVISGYDMTTEAALTKMFYLFGKGMNEVEVKEKMQANLRGELTIQNLGQA